MGFEDKPGPAGVKGDSEDLEEMISQREISQQAFRQRKPDKVIEKDYVMTWILLGMSNSRVREYCVFKGGTALKKIYFPQYRYSEDLDFTVINRSASAYLLDDLGDVLRDLQDTRAFMFGLDKDRVERRADSLTLYIDFVGPLQARLGNRNIKVDFTLEEQIICKVDKREVVATYSDCKGQSGRLEVYSLEEILIEKLCALIGRTEPRDLYDAHFLLGMKELDSQLVADFFPEKARNKNIDPSRLPTILKDKRAIIERLWDTRLGHQVEELPYLETVIRETNQYLRLWQLA